MAEITELSKRELDVLELVQRRLTNKEIAAELNISYYTAKFHISSILHKLGMQTRMELILMSYPESQRPSRLIPNDGGVLCW